MAAPTTFTVMDGATPVEVPIDWKKHVVVKQCQTETINGVPVEVPNTQTLITYSPEMFDRLNKEGKDGSPSYFAETRMKVTVLHHPNA